MSAAANPTDPTRRKKVLMVVANPSTSPTTGWPVVEAGRRLRSSELMFGPPNRSCRVLEGVLEGIAESECGRARVLRPSEG